MALLVDSGPVVSPIQAASRTTGSTVRSRRMANLRESLYVYVIEVRPLTFSLRLHPTVPFLPTTLGLVSPIYGVARGSSMTNIVTLL